MVCVQGPMTARGHCVIFYTQPCPLGLLIKCMEEWAGGAVGRRGIDTCTCTLCVTCVYLVAQSCPTLCDPRDYSPPGSSVHGILQARIPEWVAISFSIIPGKCHINSCPKAVDSCFAFWNFLIFILFPFLDIFDLGWLWMWKCRYGGPTAF